MKTAATIIQKCYRGFMVRKAYSLYRQRLSTQILCFLQQIELISNDFFTKIVKTNYCVPIKAIESSPINNFHNNKYAQKFSQYLFPPPPPPLPLPSSFTILSPPLPPPDAPTSIRPSMITSSIPLPPPPPALFLASRPSPRSRHQLIITNQSNRSPSPLSSSSISKFAQVRDIFARAEASTANSHHYHHHHHLQHHIPIKNHVQNQHSSSITSSSHQVPSIEQSGSPKPLTVLDAVQEYQKQHINIHQPGFKRFGHLGGGVFNRPPNLNGNNNLKPRGIGSFISNNNKPLLQNKQLPPIVLPNYVSSSPKQQHQQSRPITRVN